MNAFSVNFVETLTFFLLSNLHAKINLVIKMALKREVMIPITNVFAKPSTGPVPKNHKIIPVNIVVTFASIIDEKDVI